MGVNRTVIKNQATGATEVIYEQRRTSFQFWITIIAQLVGIAVVVFAAARFGVVVESKQVIEDEMLPPIGLIYMGVERCVKEEMEPLKENYLRMNFRQKTIMEDISEIKTAVQEIAENNNDS